MFCGGRESVVRRLVECFCTERILWTRREEKLLFWKKNLGEQFLLYVPLGSQMKNLAFLLEAANVNDENKIVMTTHSPCVLSYITLVAKAYELMNKGVKCNSARKNKTNGNRNAAK